MSILNLQAETRILLPNISWDVFEALAASDCAGIRFAYDRGNLEIMSPSVEHEWFHKLLGRMVEALTEVLNIPIRSGGATTLKIQLKQRGVEPDECYYISNEPRVRGKKDIDLATEPPPDLAIEVDISHSSLDKMSIYADLGVPEVWLYDGISLRVFHIQAAGVYAQERQSFAFPFLDLNEIQRFMERCEETDETSWIRSFRAWAHQSYGQSS
jgi:Uma2 family endonuclease